MVNKMVYREFDSLTEIKFSIIISDFKIEDTL